LKKSKIERKDIPMSCSTKIFALLLLAAIPATGSAQTSSCRPRLKPAQALPVMVWLTGGGNHSLSGQGTPIFGGLTYSGEKFVPQGVVFVSYNLRLGVLGFLAHPALDAERPEKISGNYGSLDQIAMLRWLKTNIAAFGGDPNKIFLFGTSARRV
jgi:para-nitrobenzyl esterase